jgi:hypothetical protein
LTQGSEDTLAPIMAHDHDTTFFLGGIRLLFESLFWLERMRE